MRGYHFQAQMANNPYSRYGESQLRSGECLTRIGNIRKNPIMLIIESCTVSVATHPFAVQSTDGNAVLTYKREMPKLVSCT
jgi:hypothetical protein